MAASVVQSPLQWLQGSSQNCVSRPAVSRSRTTALSSGKLAADGRLCLGGSSKLLRGAVGICGRTRLACTPGDEKQDVVEETVKPTEENKGIIEKIEEEMGRQFGGVLWFTVLIVCLAVFGGVYVYYIITFANFDDVPILRGPMR